jgi:hypothetical protein
MSPAPLYAASFDGMASLMRFLNNQLFLSTRVRMLQLRQHRLQQAD